MPLLFPIIIYVNCQHTVHVCVHEAYQKSACSCKDTDAFLSRAGTSFQTANTLIHPAMIHMRGLELHVVTSCLTVSSYFWCRSQTARTSASSCGTSMSLCSYFIPSVKRRNLKHNTRRHLISNSKDQCIKLWDTRMSLRSDAEVAALPEGGMPSFSWDYRWMAYPGALQTLCGERARELQCIGTCT